MFHLVAFHKVIHRNENSLKSKKSIKTYFQGAHVTKRTFDESPNKFKYSKEQGTLITLRDSKEL